MSDVQRSRVRTIVLLLLLGLSTGVGLAAAKYHGNTSSKIFHQSSCRYYDCKNCMREFNSREAAIAAGYRPCKVCNP